MDETIQEFADSAFDPIREDIRVDRVRQIAETGVDIISIGALTHSAPAADLSLKIEDV